MPVINGQRCQEQSLFSDQLTAISRIINSNVHSWQCNQHNHSWMQQLLAENAQTHEDHMQNTQMGADRMVLTCFKPSHGGNRLCSVDNLSAIGPLLADGTKTIWQWVQFIAILRICLFPQGMGDHRYPCRFMSWIHVALIPRGFIPNHSRTRSWLQRIIWSKDLFLRWIIDNHCTVIHHKAALHYISIMVLPLKSFKVNVILNFQDTLARGGNLHEPLSSTISHCRGLWFADAALPDLSKPSSARVHPPCSAAWLRKNPRAAGVETWNKQKWEIWLQNG